MSIPVLLISMLIFFTLSIGIGFLVNMFFRSVWLFTVVYLFITLLFIGEAGFFTYFTEPNTSFNQLYNNLLNIKSADIFILGFGLIGAILSGLIISILRKKGVKMF
jgi:hypothetical protein